MEQAPRQTVSCYTTASDTLAERWCDWLSRIIALEANPLKTAPFVYKIAGRGTVVLPQITKNLVCSFAC